MQAEEAQLVRTGGEVTDSTVLFNARFSDTRLLTARAHWAQ